MKLTSILAACTIMVLAVSVVHAEDVVPDVLLHPVISSVPGRTIDIRGLLPGMTPADVRPLLTEILGAEPREGYEKTALRESGQTVTGTPFIKWLSGEVGSEKTSVMFSGVSSGNQAVLITREAEYRRGDEAPLFDTFLSSLIEKYGEPAFRKDGYNGTAVIWTYKDGQPAACLPDDTPQCLEPASAFSNLNATPKYFDVIVYALVGKTRPDETRVGRYRISSTDLSIKVAADKADEAGLRPALDAVLAEAAANAPKPVL